MKKIVISIYNDLLYTLNYYKVNDLGLYIEDINLADQGWVDFLLSNTNSYFEITCFSDEITIGWDSTEHYQDCISLIGCCLYYLDFRDLCQKN